MNRDGAQYRRGGLPLGNLRPDATSQPATTETKTPAWAIQPTDVIVLPQQPKPSAPKTSAPIVVPQKPKTVSVAPDFRIVPPPLTTPPPAKPALLRQAAQAAKSAPQKAEPKVASKVKPARRKMWKILVPAMAVLLVAAGGLSTFYLCTQPKDPFDPELLSQFNTAAYFPTSLPKGYLLDPTTATVDNGALTFTAKKGSNSLFFSEQKKPANLDFSSFYQSQIPDPTTFAVLGGSATVGHFKNVSPVLQVHLDRSQNNSGLPIIASITTEKTWILITSNNTHVTTGQMTNVVKNLHP